MFFIFCCFLPRLDRGGPPRWPAPSGPPDSRKPRPGKGLQDASVFLAATTLAPWSADSAQIGSDRQSGLFQQAGGVMVGAALSTAPLAKPLFLFRRACLLRAMPGRGVTVSAPQGGAIQRREARPLRFDAGPKTYPQKRPADYRKNLYDSLYRRGGPFQRRRGGPFQRG